MLKQLYKFERGCRAKPGEIEVFYEKLPTEEKEALDKCMNDWVARSSKGVGEDSMKDNRRYYLQLRKFMNKPFNQITPEEISPAVAIIKSDKDLSDMTKNDILLTLRKALKSAFKDWSSKFNDFEDIILKREPKSKKPILPGDVFSKEKWENALKHEPRVYWKTWAIVGEEGALRTKEEQLIKWSDIRFDVDGDGISEIDIYCTKNNKKKTIFVKNATYWLKLLKEEQERQELKGLYVFNAKYNLNKPIDRSRVSNWARYFSKKTGLKYWNLLRRHERLTELYTAAEENKMSEASVALFAGHNKSLKKTYLHGNIDSQKEMIKKQIYQIEHLPPEKKADYEKQLEELKTKLNKQESKEKINNELITDLQKEMKIVRAMVGKIKK